MKKYICALTLSTLFVIGMMATSPLLAQEKAWSLVGTWVNPEYKDSNVYLPKVVYGGDSDISLYSDMNDTTPFGVGNYVIEKDWTESGVHWFNVKSSFDIGDFYEIDKLTDGGNRYEAVISQGSYPAQFDTTNPSYTHTIRERQ